MLTIEVTYPLEPAFRRKLQFVEDTTFFPGQVPCVVPKTNTNMFADFLTPDNVKLFVMIKCLVIHQRHSFTDDSTKIQTASAILRP